MGNFERAELAAFAYREARYTGSIDCIKAICYVFRNRVGAGWGDGSFVSVIAGRGLCEGNEGNSRHVELDLGDRLLHMIVRDIDDIYLGTADEPVRKVVADCLYYQFIDQPLRGWFTEHILHDPQNHPHTGNVGPLMLFR